MKFAAKMPILTLAIVLPTALCSFNGCTSRAVPLGVTLDTPEHHVLSGMRLLELGRYEDALREFNLTKQSNPDYSKAFVGSGLVWAHQGDWKKARQEMEAAGKLAKTSEERGFANVGLIRLFLMGKGLVSEKWLVPAEKAYNDTVAHLPNASEAHFYMGKVYEEAGDLEKAIDLFEKVLKINKSHTDEARAALNRVKR